MADSVAGVSVVVGTLFGTLDRGEDLVGVMSLGVKIYLVDEWTRFKKGEDPELLKAIGSWVTRSAGCI